MAMAQENQNPNQNSNQKRLIAYKVSIAEILSSQYYKEEGWEPNYVLAAGMKVSRANIIGVVVDIDFQESTNSFTLDDGTGEISVRFFENSQYIQAIKPGDTVFVIGRPREFNESRYLLGEIVRKANDVSWLKARKVEIEKERKNQLTQQNNQSPPYASSIPSHSSKQNPSFASKEKTSAVQQHEPASDEISIEETPAEKIIQKIRNLDKGSGADIEQVIEGIPSGESVIKSLMMEGEIFEVAPGRLKVLE